MNERNSDLIALIPAAGQATRLGNLPFSKELLPVSITPSRNGSERRIRVVSEVLLDSLEQAGASRAVIVIRNGKWDIPSYFSAGRAARIPICFVPISASESVPESISYALPFLRESNVAFGFPDILFSPGTAFTELSDRLGQDGDDVVLGAFPTEQTSKWDMVDIGPGSELRRIEIKPTGSELRYAWAIALWRPSFSDFLAQLGTSPRCRDGGPKFPEPIMSDILNEALEAGLRIRVHTFPNGRCLDIGTPDGFEQAITGTPWPE